MSAYSTTIQASGHRTDIDLTHLTTLNRVPPYAIGAYVNAQAGGKVNLSNVTSYTGGSTQVTADGANSVVDLSKLTDFFSDSYYNSKLEAEDGGSILTGALTTLSRADLDLDDNLSSIITSQIATIDGNNIYAAGGADLQLPDVTSYTGESAYSSTIQASGAGTEVDLSHLTSLNGAPPYTIVYVNAQAGGKVDLSQVSTYTGGSTSFHADGTGAASSTCRRCPRSSPTPITTRSWRRPDGGSLLTGRVDHAQPCRPGPRRQPVLDHHLGQIATIHDSNNASRRRRAPTCNCPM